MNQIIKKRWVKALKSGEYTQTRGYLKRIEDTTSFCPLGVLCDLHAKETGNKWTEDKYYLGCKYSLPHEVVVWAGLPKENTAITNNGQFISELNDVRRYTFTEIADVIEKEM